MASPKWSKFKPRNGGTGDAEGLNRAYEDWYESHNNSAIDACGAGALHFSRSAFNVPKGYKRGAENAGSDAQSQIDAFRAEMGALMNETFPVQTTPIPEFARNTHRKDAHQLPSKLVPKDAVKKFGLSNDGKGKTLKLERDTVIVGVVDVGIPLGHNRFRDADGNARILAAWQQMGDWSVAKQKHMPFGRELYWADIQKSLARHSKGKWLDEESFNRDTGTVDLANRLGSREAAARASHGAHVMDLAAGDDPHRPWADKAAQKAFQKRVKMIAVNIPDSRIFGAAGTFLDMFVVHAINRIITLADEMWLSCFGNEKGKDGGPIGFPVVINLSFGKQAGAKSILGDFPNMVKNLKDARSQSGRLSGLEIVMPAGNDNLGRGNAFLEPLPGKTESLNWRMQPEDQSSNFVEVWVQPNAKNPTLLSDPSAVEISVTPPGAKKAIKGQFGKDRTVSKLDDFAAIYCDHVSFSDNPDEHLIRYLICLAPSLRQVTGGAIAPAGTWKISLHNTAKQGAKNAEVQAVLSVQSDQNIFPGRPVNRLSYFDDKRYREFDQSGRPVVTYGFPSQKNLDAVAAIGESPPVPVRRHGTMNASTAPDQVVAVGGYRRSDGKPAFYSSTGRGPTAASKRKDGTKVNVPGTGLRRAPSVSFPTEESPAHYGVMAAGAASGSTVALRGTSFASPQAVREIVDILLRGGSPDWPASLTARAQAAENTPDFPVVHSDQLVEQLGMGRLPSRRESAVPRK